MRPQSLPHINRIATAFPAHEVHGAFRAFAGHQLDEARMQVMFARLADKSQIDGRRSVLEPLPDGTGAACGRCGPRRGCSSGGWATPGPGRWPRG